MSQAIRFCPHCGTPVEVQALWGANRLVCPSCSWIYFADPKVAAAVLVEQDGQVLLTRRANDPYRGMWTLPAGFVNAHEDPARAAERECQEETGLEVQVVTLLDVIAGREHERGADIIIIYQAKVIGGSLKPGDDADRAAFFPRDALPSLAFAATRAALKVDGY
ncbi:MAG TPA: NUDIX hydrolase [Levilinea sp.]|nr:NUDIX hydrolase [Levilinea sp.]